MEKEIEKRVSVDNCTYTWPDYPTLPNKPLETGTNIAYFTPSPSILAVEVKDKILFYYIRDNAIYYAIYEKGSPIVFKQTYDLAEIFKTIGFL